MNEHLKTELGEIDELVRAERYANALERVEELTRQYPNEPSIWMTRAYMNSRQGNTEDAIEDVSKAIELCAIEPDYYFTRGRLSFKISRYGEAVLDFTEVLRLCDVHNSDYYREGAYFRRADAYARLKQYGKAKADCEHVRDGFETWTDSLRTKECILSECGG